jgi:hypothetical protein
VGRAHLASFNRRGKAMLRLGRLRQQTSRDGTLTLAGRIGMARLVVSQGEPDADGNPVWNVDIVEL